MSDTEVPDQSMSEQLGFSGPEEELEAIDAKMAEIKKDVTEELVRDWPSPWKGEAMVGAKVTGRLSAHKAYQTLLARRRELEAQLGVSTGGRQTEEAQDPMGSYAAKIRKSKEAGAEQ